MTQAPLNDDELTLEDFRYRLEHGGSITELSDLEAIIAAAARIEHEGWRPIETAPKDGTWVLLWVPGFNTPDVAGWIDGRWVVPDDYFDLMAPYGEPTHWMPLPLPPQQDGKEEDGHDIASNRDCDANPDRLRPGGSIGLRVESDTAENPVAPHPEQEGEKQKPWTCDKCGEPIYSISGLLAGMRREVDSLRRLRELDAEEYGEDRAALIAAEKQNAELQENCAALADAMGCEAVGKAIRDMVRDRTEFSEIGDGQRD